MGAPPAVTSSDRSVVANPGLETERRYWPGLRCSSMYLPFASEVVVHWRCGALLRLLRGECHLCSGNGVAHVISHGAAEREDVLSRHDAADGQHEQRDQPNASAYHGHRL